jgi:uroporphyrinogen-III synthase
MPLAGMRVLSLESRRAAEMATLISKQGGEAFVAPSMREAPLDSNEEAFVFAEQLFGGEFDMMIFLTGVGTRALHRLLATRYAEEMFPEALRQITVAARGPKPVAALRELQVPIHVVAPEPNTWRELLQSLEGRTERRVAVQEYGKSNQELLDALRQRGVEVTSVRVYQWDLPEDTTPLRTAARKLAAGEFEVALFTTSIQIPHLFRMAAEEGVQAEMERGLKRCVIASIGPTTSEMLDEYGIATDVTPKHPKMGFLVKETAEQAEEILCRKRQSAE